MQTKDHIIRTRDKTHILASNKMWGFRLKKNSMPENSTHQSLQVEVGLALLYLHPQHPPLLKNWKRTSLCLHIFFCRSQQKLKHGNRHENIVVFRCNSVHSPHMDLFPSTLPSFSLDTNTPVPQKPMTLRDSSYCWTCLQSQLIKRHTCWDDTSWWKDFSIWQVIRLSAKPALNPSLATIETIGNNPCVTESQTW